MSLEALEVKTHSLSEDNDHMTSANPKVESELTKEIISRTLVPEVSTTTTNEGDIKEKAFEYLSKLDPENLVEVSITVVAIQKTTDMENTERKSVTLVKNNSAIESSSTTEEREFIETKEMLVGVSHSLKELEADKSAHTVLLKSPQIVGAARKSTTAMLWESDYFDPNSHVTVKSSGELEKANDSGNHDTSFTELRMETDTPVDLNSGDKHIIEDDVNNSQELVKSLEVVFSKNVDNSNIQNSKNPSQQNLKDVQNSNPIENGEVDQLSLYIQQENNGDHGEFLKNQDRIGKESLEGHEELVKSTISSENIHVKALKDHVSTTIKADLFFEGSKMMENQKSTFSKNETEGTNRKFSDNHPSTQIKTSTITNDCGNSMTALKCDKALAEAIEKEIITFNDPVAFDFSIKNETPHKEQDAAITSPDPSNISENQLYNLVGRSLTKNFVKHPALQTTSPTQNHHEVESYSEKQPDFSVHTALQLRQPLRVDENQNMLGNVEIIIGNGSSSPVLNEEEGDHLTTNQLSVILNRLQNRLNDMTVHDEDFIAPLPSPRRLITRPLSSDYSIMSDITFSEANTPVMTPVHSFRGKLNGYSPTVNSPPQRQKLSLENPRKAAPAIEFKSIQPISAEKGSARGRTNISNPSRGRSKSPASSENSKSRGPVFAFGRVVHASDERGRSRVPVDNRNAVKSPSSTVIPQRRSLSLSRERSKSPTATLSVNKRATLVRSASPSIRRETRGRSKSPAVTSSEKRIPFSNISARARSRSPAVIPSPSRFDSLPKSRPRPSSVPAQSRRNSSTPRDKSTRSKSPAITGRRSNNLDARLKGGAEKRPSSVPPRLRTKSPNRSNPSSATRVESHRQTSLYDPTTASLSRTNSFSPRLARSVSTHSMSASSVLSLISSNHNGRSIAIEALGSRVSLLSNFSESPKNKTPVRSSSTPPTRSDKSMPSARSTTPTSTQTFHAPRPWSVNRNTPGNANKGPSSLQNTTPVRPLSANKTIVPQRKATPNPVTITPPNKTSTTSRQAPRTSSPAARRVPPVSPSATPHYLAPLQRHSVNATNAGVTSSGQKDQKLSHLYEHSGEKQNKAANWYAVNYAASAALTTVKNRPAQTTKGAKQRRTSISSISSTSSTTKRPSSMRSTTSASTSTSSLKQKPEAGLSIFKPGSKTVLDSNVSSQRNSMQALELEITEVRSISTPRNEALPSSSPAGVSSASGAAVTVEVVERFSRKDSPSRSFSPRKLEILAVSPVNKLIFDEEKPRSDKLSVPSSSPTISPKIGERKALKITENILPPTVVSPRKSIEIPSAAENEEEKSILTQEPLEENFNVPDKVVPPIESLEQFLQFFQNAKPIPLFTASEPSLVNGSKSGGAGRNSRAIITTSSTSSTSSYKQKLKRKEQLIFMPSLKHTLQKTIDTVYKVTKLREDSKTAMTSIQHLISRSSSMDYEDEDLMNLTASPRSSAKSSLNGPTLHLNSHHFHNANPHLLSQASPARNTSNQKHFYSYKKSLSVRNIQKLLSLANVSYAYEGGTSPKRHSSQINDFESVNSDLKSKDLTDDQSIATQSTSQTNATAVTSSKPVEELTTAEIIEEMKAKALSGEGLHHLHFLARHEEGDEDNDDEEEEMVIQQEEEETNKEVHVYVPSHLLPETTNNTTTLMQSLMPFMSRDYSEELVTTAPSKDIVHDQENDSRRFTLSIV